MTPTMTATMTPTMTATMMPSMTATMTPTMTATMTPTMTATMTPSMTATMTPTMTPMMSYSYEITLLNLTNSQPLSPLFAHLNTGSGLWQAGEKASMGLEYLAEGGDTSVIMTEAMDDMYHVAYQTGTGAIMPGMSETVTVMGDFMTGEQAYLSLASMLVNTNDAFTGVEMLPLSDLNVDEHTQLYIPAWDAGTEMNSAMMGTMPGPADHGVGFNMDRDDVDFIHVHPGILSSYELTDSVLKNEHKFDNPVARLTVKRVK
jgi:hypothetical protein